MWMRPFSRSGGVLGPRVVRRLKVVRVSDPAAIDMTLFPHFMLIGPQRTGTTWAAQNLGAHPAIFIPWEKELHYFNNIQEPGKIERRGGSTELAWYLDHFRPSRDSPRRQCGVGDRTSPVSVLGEATAGYAASLGPEVMRDLRLLKPDLRAILLVRNPIDRAWSHAKLELSVIPGRPMEDVPEDEVRAFLTRDYQIACGHYTAIISRWRRALRRGHLFVAPYDDIGRDSRGLLARLFDFLGVHADAGAVGAAAVERINPTPDLPVPMRYRDLLEPIYRKEMVRLARLGYRWHD